MRQYALAMQKYGLQRGIDGSEARHTTTQEYYRELFTQKDSIFEKVECLKQEQEEVRDKTWDLYDRKDEAREKFLAMDSYLEHKKAEIIAVESQLKEVKNDLDPDSVRSDYELACELFPSLKETIRVSKECISVGFSKDQTREMTQGKTVQFTGELYSEEHKRSFKADNIDAKLMSDAKDSSRLHLTINGTPITEWFRNLALKIEKAAPEQSSPLRIKWGGADNLTIYMYFCFIIDELVKGQRMKNIQSGQEYGIINNLIQSKGGLPSTNLALATHYLHNYHNGVCKFFEPSAMASIDTIMQNDLFLKNKNSVIKKMLKEVESAPFPTPDNYSFTFIDLFAGIGGFRMAMQSLGGKCVFSSEWDKDAQKTYFANFGEVPFGDITSKATKDFVPDNFDVLCAGFPCQAFSIAGKRGGFEDTRGTLFFDVATIIKEKKPKAIFLENVKGLTNHNGGKTLATILNTLREDLNYYVPEPKIINAKNFGVPQNRERIYIVAFRKDLKITNFTYPEPLGKEICFADIKEKNVVSAKYYLSTQYLQTLKAHKARHESKGNGFGYEIISDSGCSNAIVVGGMGRERNLVIDNKLVDFTPVTKIKGEVNREGIRKMTPREWARLQGFPDSFVIPVADASAYKQFGNSVAVPAIRATGEKIINLLKNKL